MASLCGNCDFVRLLSLFLCISVCILLYAANGVTETNDRRPLLEIVPPATPDDGNLSFKFKFCTVFCVRVLLMVGTEQTDGQTDG